MNKKLNVTLLFILYFSGQLFATCGLDVHWDLYTWGYQKEDVHIDHQSPNCHFYEGHGAGYPKGWDDLPYCDSDHFWIADYATCIDSHERCRDDLKHVMNLFEAMGVPCFYAEYHKEWTAMWHMAIYIGDYNIWKFDSASRDKEKYSGSTYYTTWESLSDESGYFLCDDVYSRQYHKGWDDAMGIADKSWIWGLVKEMRKEMKKK